MTLARVHALHRRWDLYPPVEVFAAGYFGHKPSRPPVQRSERGDVGDLMKMLGVRPGQTVAG